MVNFRSLFRLISFLAVFSMASAVHAEISEQRALEYVRDKVGPLVSRDKIPTIRTELDRAAGAFTEIQSQRLESNSVNTSELFLVHSSQVNAFVMVVRAPGQSRSKNLVFLTTEMLREWLLRDSRYTFNESMTQLVGILAHEFGHPVDKLDSSTGIEDHYGKTGSQAVEVRADYEADVLLEKAGYPPDALHKALIRLVGLSKKRTSTLAAAAGTHPDDELRLSIQRSRLTASRLLKGQAKGESVHVSSAVSTQAIHELAALVDPVNKIDFAPPRSMFEAADRLKRILVENRTELNVTQKKEALTLTLWFDQELEDLSKDVSRSELEARRIFVEALLSTRREKDKFEFTSRVAEYDLSSRSAVENAVKREVPNHGLRDFRGHATRLERLELLPEAELRTALKQSLLELHSAFLSPMSGARGMYDYAEVLGTWASTARSVAPIEMIYEVWAANPMDYRRRADYSPDKTQLETDRYAEVVALFDGLASETHATSMNRLRTGAAFEPIVNHARVREIELRRAKPSPDDESRAATARLRNKIAEFIGSYDRTLLSGFPKTSVRFDFARGQESKYPTKWFHGVEKFANRYYRTAWQNRGFHGFKELTGRNSLVVDWNLVTKFANPSLSVHARNSMIRKSVIEHFRSVDIETLEASLLARFLNPQKKLITLDQVEGKNLLRPSWYSVEVARAYRQRPEVASPAAPKDAANEISSVPRGFKSLVRSFDLFIERNFLSPSLTADKKLLLARFEPALQQAVTEHRQIKPEAEWTFADFETVNVRAFHIAFNLNLLDEKDVKFAFDVFQPRSVWFQEAYLGQIEKIALSTANRSDILFKVFFSLENQIEIENPKYQFEGMYPASLLRNREGSHQWLFHTADDKSNPLAIRVYRELQRAQLVRNLPDLMALIEKAAAGKSRYHDLEYSEAMNSMRGIFIEEIGEALKTQTDRQLFETFRRYANLLHSFTHKDARKGQRQNRVINTDLFAEPLVKIWEKAKWNSKERYQAFIELTNHWTSPKTDEMFLRYIRPMLNEAEYDITIQRLLGQNRIYSEELRIELAEKQLNLALDRRQNKADGREASINDLFQSLELFERMAPNDTVQRDEVLERIGWRLQLLSQRLKAFVDDPKSTNWAKHNPRWLGVASSLSTLVTDLSISDKFNLLNFVVEYKQNSGLPDWLIRRFYASFLRDARAGKKASSEKDLHRIARETTYHTRESFQRLLDQTTPLQRLPFIELILGSKNFELMSRPNIFDQILDRHLKFDPKTSDRVHLEAYLAIIPAHERGVTLAYLLAQSQDKAQKKTGSLKAVLEAFPPVGIKLGQRGRTYGIFGPEYDEELAELKDNAKRMDRSAIEDQIRNALEPHERAAKIRILELKGSASVGVVVIAEIEFPGQKPVRVALKVQRPNLADQIKTNMDLGRRYIKEVAARKNQKPSRLFEALVDAMDIQFASEIDFREEAKSTILAQKLVRELRKGLSPKDFAGWSVDVPDVSNVIAPKRTLVAFQAIDGETLKSAIKNKSISEVDRAALGELATQIALSMFFKYGVFDPDRHMGNWMVDLKAKVLYMIDLGQLTRYKKTRNPFSADDRLALADFMRAFKSRDVDLLIHAIAKMSVDSNMSSDLKQKTKEALAKWARQSSSSQDLQSSIRELVDTVYELGHELRPDFTFGALNGLLTLAGENYVSAERFEAILEAHVKTIMVKKAPLAVSSLVSEKFGQMKDRLNPRRSGGTCEALFQPAPRQSRL